ncbi:ATP-dependent DNA helicase Q5-like [Tropilaelaps mercedesae]|uniref:ATP-dependent DNA helicase Q5-like n=1 Tax=Tropilaelaps mercedesae TaxID=418985 RepID=A0A1V9X2M0_9ACAR|nr:ATP-dependent DNA helicase Q5-like [Tropilaelaps mercedesae]
MKETPFKKTLFNLLQDVSKKMNEKSSTAEVMSISSDNDTNSHESTSFINSGVSTGHENSGNELSTAPSSLEVHRVKYLNPSSKRDQGFETTTDNATGFLVRDNTASRVENQRGTAVTESHEQKPALVKEEFPKLKVKYFFEVNGSEEIAEASVKKGEAEIQPKLKKDLEEKLELGFKTGLQMVEEQQESADAQKRVKKENSSSRSKRSAGFDESSTAKRRFLNLQQAKKDLTKAIACVNKLLYPEFKRGTISKERFKLICKKVSNRVTDNGTLDEATIKNEITQELHCLKYF